MTMFDVNNLDFLNDTGSLVVLMCGIAGSGKTTFARQLEEKGFIKLSIDEEIWATNGRYGIDYPVEMYEELSKAAELNLRNQLLLLLKEKRNIVIDFSFWQRERRQLYKTLIEDAGGSWKLIYLKVAPEELRKRLLLRSDRFDANASFKITDELLSSYLKGFEEPLNEGEIVIEA